MLCVRKAEISEIPAVMQFIAEQQEERPHTCCGQRLF